MDSVSFWRNDPAKVAAHAAVARAVKDGTLVRPDRCEECCDERRIIAHHDDYSKPLDVRWLCYPCHRNYHNSLTGRYGRARQRIEAAA